MRCEFFAFLKQYGVVGLAIAVVIGGKANALVTARVDGIKATDGEMEGGDSDPKMLHRTTRAP